MVYPVSPVVSWFPKFKGVSGVGFCTRTEIWSLPRTMSIPSDKTGDSLCLLVYIFCSNSAGV